MAYERKRRAPQRLDPSVTPKPRKSKSRKNTKAPKKAKPVVEQVEENGNAENQDGSYVVESVAGVCLDVPSEGPQVLIKWQGYHSSESTWEPIDNVDDQTILDNFTTLIDKIKAFKSTKSAGRSKKGAKTKGEPEVEYEVEEILGIWYDHEDNRIRYKIKWKGYPYSQCTWELDSNLTSCDEMLQSISDSAEYLQKTFIDNESVKAPKRGGKKR